MGAKEWTKAVRSLKEAQIIEVKKDILPEEVAQRLKELTRKKSKSGQAARRLLVAHGEMAPRGEVYVMGVLSREDGKEDGVNSGVEAIYFSPKGWRKTEPTTIEAVKQGTFNYDFENDQRVSAMDAVIASLDSMNGSRKLYEVVPTFSSGLDTIASRLGAKARKLQFGKDV